MADLCSRGGDARDVVDLIFGTQVMREGRSVRLYFPIAPWDEAK